MKDLEKELVKCIENGENLTFDEFFDKHDISKEDRNDFAISAIVKKAKDYLD